MRYIIWDKQKPQSEDCGFCLARELGFEPRTDRLHIILIFRIGVDYIIIPKDARRFDLFTDLLLADSL